MKENDMVNTHPIWGKFPKIQAFLTECLELIIEKITIENKEIEQTVIDLIERQGKLLRPAYFFLFSQFGSAGPDAHQKIVASAASTEVLHLATLIHDDIIDESNMRRGTETVQSKHGKDVAVYTGDLLDQPAAFHVSVIIETAASSSKVRMRLS